MTERERHSERQGMWYASGIISAALLIWWILCQSVFTEGKPVEFAIKGGAVSRDVLWHEAWNCRERIEWMVKEMGGREGAIPM